MRISFIETEDGAVTVDWVVLTAALVALGLAVMISVSTGVQSTVAAIDANMNAPSVITRMNHGFGYAAHDQATFNRMIVGMAGMDPADLDQIAAFFNEVNESDLSGLSDDERGQLADINTAIDMAYVDAGGTRITETSYDAVTVAALAEGLGIPSAEAEVAPDA
ncbi:hypothetical protein ACK8OR_08695 [Jannaschia sp. KMU-145]|uniref:hypothetical protein n=1 Tax=Jannaschia halovivens TaxID=3388667 RepID=UPI00396B35EC